MTRTERLTTLADVELFALQMEQVSIPHNVDLVIYLTEAEMNAIYKHMLPEGVKALFTFSTYVTKTGLQVNLRTKPLH